MDSSYSGHEGVIGSGEHVNITSGFIKRRKFHYLSEYWFPKKGSAKWNKTRNQLFEIYVK
jgi:hypothetical protein